ncbi:unnamed protein product [Caenorhabditis bovis]|uniref:Protein kinase domain-containing protein n=1 Tax=Caenorhabditis bovis TaxID=2654633 RepID=A0A8S1F2K9_9PELO|nr:unnamed protein product [Caenorhabditis bovis]
MGGNEERNSVSRKRNFIPRLESLEGNPNQEDEHEGSSSKIPATEETHAIFSQSSSTSSASPSSFIPAIVSNSDETTETESTENATPGNEKTANPASSTTKRSHRSTRNSAPGSRAANSRALAHRASRLESSRASSVRESNSEEETANQERTNERCRYSITIRIPTGVIETLIVESRTNNANYLNARTVATEAANFFAKRVACSSYTTVSLVYSLLNSMVDAIVFSSSFHHLNNVLPPPFEQLVTEAIEAYTQHTTRGIHLPSMVAAARRTDPFFPLRQNMPQRYQRSFSRVVGTLGYSTSENQRQRPQEAEQQNSASRPETDNAGTSTEDVQVNKKLNTNERIEKFIIQGCGPTAKAIDIHTRRIYLATIVTDQRKENIEKLTERINNCYDYASSLPRNFPDIKNLVLPRECRMIVSKGRNIYFTPCSKMTVHHYVAERGHNLTEREALDIFRGIVDIVFFCHKIGIILKEIKARKLGLVRNETVFTVNLETIADCLLLDNIEDDQVSCRIACPAYVAPERIFLSPTHPTYSGRSADIWTMGITLYTMLFGKYPFFGKTPQSVFRSILSNRLTFPENSLEETTIQLVKRMLEKNPSARPTIDEINEMDLNCLRYYPCRSKHVIAVSNARNQIRRLLLDCYENARECRRAVCLEHISVKQMFEIITYLNRKRYKQVDNLIPLINYHERLEETSKRFARLNFPCPIRITRGIVDDESEKMFKIRCMSLYTDFEYSILNARLAQINKLIKKERTGKIVVTPFDGDVELPDVIELDHLPLEILMPPEIHIPRPGLIIKKNSVADRVYNMLHFHNALQFPLVKHNGQALRFSDQIYLDLEA